MVQTFNRHITLTGSVNFRDLGGLPTTSGAMVQTGKLYRSDALSSLTDTDLEHLAGKRLATVIDLRTDHELETTAPTRLRDIGVRHVQISILEGNLTRGTLPGSPESLGKLYVHMVERAGDRFEKIFNTIAEPDNLPAVFHCAAGKDRTGVTTAFVLSVLGVSREVIVADYALTDANMARLIEQREREGQQISRPDIPPHFMRAVPETMESFLATIDERWGSAEGYLGHIGVPAAALDAIRGHLLT